MKKINTAVIIPAYNESKIIAETIASIDCGDYLIICVDDGSTDGTAEVIANTSAILIQHPINMGQGGAIQTGIDYALQLNQIKYFVTYDADGQHSPDDVAFMLKVISDNKVDVVLGSRFLGEALSIKKSKKLILKLAVVFTNKFSHVNLTDTHNGLRVFNRQFAKKLNITMPDMAHASEIIDKLGRGKWKYIEVPVTIRYTEYSTSRGQSLLNLFNILYDVMNQRGSRR